MMTADRPPLADGVPDRLYGRRRGHPLRPRQQRLLEETLPRLRLTPAQAADPRAAFGMGDVPLWVTGLAVSDWKSPDHLTVTHPTLASLGQQLTSELAISF